MYLSVREGLGFQLTRCPSKGQVERPETGRMSILGTMWHDFAMTVAYQWTPLIIAHTTAAISALIVGAVLLFKKKGNFSHRLLGWVWVGFMLSVALMSFGIRRDSYSWIHALSVFTLVMLFVGVRHARMHRTAHHGKTMKGIYLGALVVTGLFTLLPSRLIGSEIW